MATSTSGTQRPATKRSTTRRKPASTGTRTAASTRRTATRTSAGARRGATRTTTSTQPKTRAAQAQVLAERAVLVPVGAGLLAGDNLVSTVKGLAAKYRTRPARERELKRYERRGVTARNRFERQVRRARTRFERELRQRRSLVERTMRQNQGRLNRELSSVRRDFEKQSGAVSARVERLVSNAQGLINS
ncbi:MAG TPA: hypothetical protein VFH80_26360 [Solirubrobacteraceae bacterium]|nr:hypothetical protein [Solirubrobacteraceae bacterium]